MFIKLNGKEYELKFTYNAIRNLEKHYCMGIGKINNELDMESIETLNTFIWAMLKREDDWKNSTTDDVAEAIDKAIETGDIEFLELANILDKAVSESMLSKQTAKKGKQRTGKKGK